MTKHLTWREIRDQLNELDDSELDKTACVWLNDMVWMIDEGGTAGCWPISGTGWAMDHMAVFIDDGEED